MELLMGVYFFLFGLIIGAFLNACIYRISMSRSVINPRSVCPFCGTALGLKDLILRVRAFIPVVSWILQKRKCRYCNQKISATYPANELITGILFTGCYYKFGLSIELLAALYFISLMIIVFAVDLTHMIIPNSVVAAGIIGGFVFSVCNLYRPFGFYISTAWWNPFLAAAGSFSFLLLFSIDSLFIYKI